VAALGLCACAPAPEPADLVLLNGGIYTVDRDRSWAEALAVRAGVIVAVGDNDAVRDYVGDGTTQIDLEGRMAMPGLHDSHIHPLEGAYEAVYCNLWDADSEDRIRAMLEACAARSDGAWLEAVGLNLGLFGLTGPDKSLLDGIADGRYVFVDGSDGHAALVNDRLLELAGIGADTPDPADGVIERRAGGREPNGTVRESARDRVAALRPPRELDTSIWAMGAAVRKLNSLGITSVYDTWIGEHEMQVYAALARSGALSLRVLGAITDEGPFEKHTGEDLERVIRERDRYESEQVRFDAVKFFVDGVFEGETAAVLEPYASTGHRGVLNHEPDEFRARVSRYYALGFQLHFHTMGDAAARAALDALEYARANATAGSGSRRHALSHLGLIDPADMPRFVALDAAAVFTPVWGYPSQWTFNLEIPTLGRERVGRMYPLRSVVAAGGVIAGSSDWNYGELDPLVSIETAVTRQDPFGPPEYPPVSDESVNLATIIDAYTVNGAWLMEQDDSVGSIEPGKIADIVVFDRNLFEIAPAEISEARVDLTIFGGRVVYDRQRVDTE
jgi:predicted amidohydrolase YtcJ